MIPELTKEIFERYVGETFTVGSGEGQSVPLKLAKVVETTPQEPAKRAKVCTESFSVYFEGASDARLGQGIHTFKHDGLGEMALFMVPVVSRTPEVRRYEVVFNRLVKS